MAGLALPKLRWLLMGALAAGGWVVWQDGKVPRPPARVPVSQQRLTLPRTLVRPPARPQNIVTGSIPRPDMRLLQATSRVNVRARADLGSPVVATLEIGQIVKELSRSEPWRLVVADDVKGWVHHAYLKDPTRRQLRPLMPVLGKSQKAGSVPAPKR